jgi:hypothetical protein
MPKLHYYHDGLVKKPSQKDQPKRPSQNGCPNRLIQNGILVKLDMGARKPFEGFLNQNSK